MAAAAAALSLSAECHGPSRSCDWLTVAAARTTVPVPPCVGHPPVGRRITVSESGPGEGPRRRAGLVAGPWQRARAAAAAAGRRPPAARGCHGDSVSLSDSV
jgi:hypothetical protein